MLDLFKARLKAKSIALGANLSQKRIDAFADRLHKKFPDLTEEADHDTKIDDLNDVVDFPQVAKEDDRLRTLENKAAKPEKKEDQKSDESEKKPEAKEEKQTDEMPAWFKAYAEKVERLEAKEQKQTMQQKLSAHDKLKGLPQDAVNLLLKGRQLPQNDDELETFADSIAEDVTALQTVLKPEGVNGASRPKAGTPGSSTSKPNEKEIDAILDKI